jgi:hypothetical protein
MSMKNREALKSFFRKGQLPSEVHFSHLIDSMVNKLDDNYDKTPDDGLKLSPSGKKDSLISFFNDPIDQDPSWQLNFKKDGDQKNLSLGIPTETDGVQTTNSRLFLSSDGRIGLGTEKPQTDIDLSGTTGIRSRVGTFRIGSVSGDGDWKNVFAEPLSGIHAFEIVARIDGPPKHGRYALTHAIAVSTYGTGSNRIKQTRAYFGGFRNRIEFRWSGADNFSYNLQVRTRRHFGLDEQNLPFPINFHVTCLWDDALFKI